MIPAYAGLGSNQGDRVGHLERALRALEGIEGASLAAVSSYYDTEPVGDPRAPRYLNAVAGLFTSLDPEALWAALREVEREGGRSDAARSGARTIDIDLLYHGDSIVRRPGLRVPHPWIADRLFVLIPMVEIAPEWVDPELRIRLVELLRRRSQASVRWAGRRSG